MDLIQKVLRPQVHWVDLFPGSPNDLLGSPSRSAMANALDRPGNPIVR